ncbi:MAG: hypothetical protein ABIZ95_01595 [Pyrinomonadaceae bacterium]
MKNANTSTSGLRNFLTYVLFDGGVKFGGAMLVALLAVDIIFGGAGRWWDKYHVLTMAVICFLIGSFLGFFNGLIQSSRDN